MSYNFGPHDFDCGCARCEPRRAANRSRVEGNVAVRATLREIEALGAERARAFLEGIAAVIGADKKASE